MGKITDEQKKIIESFSCERLTNKQENKELIKSFQNDKGRSLVRYLQRLAWDEDTIEKGAKRTQEWLRIVQGMNQGGQERELAIQLLENFRSAQL